mmetsp:Transcript_98165/g.194405  ORF Transcript_98165/g.194405 Transcript_98165/m.194405 type:complete len:111 (+) Transcript_98165:207-539(+)
MDMSWNRRLRRRQKGMRMQLRALPRKQQRKPKNLLLPVTNSRNPVHLVVRAKVVVEAVVEDAQADRLAEAVEAAHPDQAVEADRQVKATTMEAGRQVQATTMEVLSAPKW